MDCRRLTIHTEKVIEAVKGHTNLWNRCDKHYRSKRMRVKSWRAVCRQVLDSFDDYREEEQQELEKRVSQRWRTARDCFMKARSRAAAGLVGPETSYMFMDQLEFLELRPRPVPADGPPPAGDPPPGAAPSLPPNGPRPSPRQRRYPMSRVDSDMSSFERSLLALLRKAQTPLEQDDESFFRSLAPLLGSLDPQTKLLFRSKVLSIAIQIQTQNNGMYLEMQSRRTSTSPPPLDQYSGELGDEMEDMEEMEEPPEKKYRPDDDGSSVPEESDTE